MSASLAAQDPRFENRKLSARMAPAPAGNVSQDFRAHGNRVAYQVTSQESGQSTLWVGSLDGSAAAVALTPAYGVILDFRWTPDGSRLVYSAVDGSTRLYSVLADASAPPLDLGPVYIRSWWVDATSERVVYRNGALFSVPIDGSAPAVQLSAPALPGGESASVELCGTRVVYESNQFAAGHYDLFSAPIDGSAPPVQISHAALLSIVGTTSFALDPTGTRAVYLAFNDTRNNLFSAPIDGSAPAALIIPPLRSGQFVLDLAITPDGADVVYRHDLSANQRYDLFRVPIDGSAPPVNLTQLPAGLVASERLSPDGAFLVYIGRATSVPFKLWSVPLDGSSAPVVLDPDVSSTDPESYWITPDSTTVLFLEEQPTGELEIHGIPIDGSSPAHPITETPNGPRSWVVTPDSQTLVYSALTGTPATPGLFQAAIHPLGPPSPMPFGELLPETAQILGLELDPAGAQALFVGDPFVDNRFELFASPLAGAPLRRTLSDPLPIEVRGDASAFLVRKGRVVYAADQEQDGQVELFGAPLDGSAPPVKLSGSLVPGGNVRLRAPGHPPFEVSADGTRVAFVADAEVDEVFELYSAPTDGSAPRVKLSLPLSSGADVHPFGFRFTRDGSRVVYRADQAANPGQRLYVVPALGGLPFELARTDTHFFDLTADSTRAVYGDTQLHVAALDGSSSPVPIGGPVDALVDFRLTSTRVVYRAVRAGQTRLFSVALGGGLEVELNEPLVAGAKVGDYAVTSAGNRVVFLSDARVRERFLLCSVAVDRSSPLRILNGPLAAGGDVVRFELAPDDARVVYLADQFADKLYNPFSVPIDGSAPAVRLSTGDVGKYTHLAVTPDSAHVLLGDGRFGTTLGLRVLPIGGGPERVLDARRTNGFKPSTDGKSAIYHTGNLSERGLYSVPLDVGGPLRLTPSFLTGGLLTQEDDPRGDFAFQLDGDAVVYVACQERALLYELFVSTPRRFSQPPPRR